MFSDINKLLDFIRTKPNVSIGTLGPEGTSSDHTLDTLISKDVRYKKILLSDFSRVYESLDNSEIDIAMVPAAYTNATDFFWSPSFSLVGSLASPTPDYHLVINEDKETFETIASVKAVEHLINNNFSRSIKGDVKLIYANSTIDAARKVVAGQADACLTNDYGARLTGLKVLATTPGVNMVWSFFQRKV